MFSQDPTTVQKLKSDIELAIKEGVFNFNPEHLVDGNIEPKKVDSNFIISLLEGHESEVACLPSGDSTQSDHIFNNLTDLVDHFMGPNGINLAHGMSRHIPKAISNISETNEELKVLIKNAWDESEGKLMPLFKAYFKSETYSCKKDGQI